MLKEATVDCFKK